MLRRDFLKSIPMLSVSPLAMAKFGAARREDVPVPCGTKKTLVMAKSISVGVYGWQVPLFGKIWREPDGSWMLQAQETGNSYPALMYGFHEYISMCLPRELSLHEVIGRCEDRARKGLGPKCDVSAAVFSGYGNYHVTREPWRDIEFDILPEKYEDWTISWREGSNQST